jgi:hypothetical protein
MVLKWLNRHITHAERHPIPWVKRLCNHAHITKGPTTCRFIPDIYSIIATGWVSLGRSDVLRSLQYRRVQCPQP